MKTVGNNSEGRFSWAMGWLALGLGLCIGLFPRTGIAGDVEADQEVFFEKEVRPILAGNCFQCHGPEKQKGGLRLDSRESILLGGESGPAVTPGKLDESLLVEAVHQDGLRMPPKGKLKDDQIQTLERWITIGAPWPDHGHAVPSTAAKSKSPKIRGEDRAWWAFQPLQRPNVPASDGVWARNEIDRFIFRKLAENHLAPTPEADRRTLIRRATFDLTGLPPTPEEIEAFLNDPAPDAYERLVDRLLDSPRYGEQWARHWLDLVRYAESDGYNQDAFRPHAWRYRDYVVRSFNEDKPYDQFVTEQLAGDELAPDDPEMRAATQFLRLWAYEYNQRNVTGQWAAILNDLTDVTGDVFLGLGIGCARCHDHKFDPILQRDYYRLQAFFTPLVPRDDLVEASKAKVADDFVRKAAWDLMTADLRQEIADFERPFRMAGAQTIYVKFTPDLQAIIDMPAVERNPLERQYAYMMERQLVEEGRFESRIKGDDKTHYDELKRRLAEYDRYRPEPPTPAFTATDVGPEAPPTLIPGDRRGESIEPGFLTILDPDPAAIETPANPEASTGRRLTLAHWLTRPDHPLTTRVIVNRLWQYHFGRGLVATSSDFGHLGEPPSHPELLDWLTLRFLEEGWSLKAIHRLIMTSATYRQSALRPTAEVAAAQQIDPENRLLWKRTTTRLEADPIRDAMLRISGELDLQAGGPSVAASQPRRSLYTIVMRNTHDPLLAAFDAPDGSSSVAMRNITTTPTQSLLMINGPWTLARAEAFAGRVQHEASSDPARIVERAYRLAFGRPPSEIETNEALAFLHHQSELTRKPAPEVAGCDPAEMKAGAEIAPEAIIDFCHALLNSNEFLYLD